ncbi:MAG: high-potential iron-sulfur protein, partial [Bacillota bacterium]
MSEQPKLTRRNFCRAATLTGAAFAIGVIPLAHAQKASKEAMKYQDKPNNGQTCDKCQFFQAPKSCSIVDGDISPKGWCTAFTAK